MALDWLRRAPLSREQHGLAAEAESPQDGGGQWGGLSRNDWIQLLEQAGDLNDELCRENCELHREVSLLRQRARQRAPRKWAAASGAAARNAEKARRAKAVLPLVMSHVRRALRFAGMPTEPVVDGLDIPSALEKTIQDAVLAWIEARSGEAGAELGMSLASSEETAALVSEKVALKELSMRQQERLFELELAREKLSGSTHGHWAHRLTSALSGPLALHATPTPDRGAAGGPATPPAACQAAEATSPDAQVTEPLPEQTPPPVPQQFAVSPGDLCEVVGRNGAILRESEELDSVKVDIVPPGNRVRILEVGIFDVRRARVVAIAAPPEDGDAGDVAEPPSGWLSVTTKDGKALIRPIIVHDAPSAAPVGPDAPGSGAECEPGEAVASATEIDAADGPAISDGAAGQPAPAAEHSESSAAAPSAASRAPEVQTPKTGRRAVTVSTDAWLALRNERLTRERQIKALETQVASARHELEQLAEVRAQLREQRSVALEMRRRGNEFYEVAAMAAEEMRCLAVLGSCSEERQAEPTQATPAASCSDATAENRAEAVSGDSGAVDPGAEASPEADVAAAAAAARQRVVEWRRLLSERETTARELSHTLERVEELEQGIEEKRIELQVAERRRERERRSLLTALREFGADTDNVPHDADAAEEAPGDATCGVSSPSLKDRGGGGAAATSASGGGAVAREQRYLQRIDELEQTVARLRAQLEQLQVRETALNRSAVARGGALRYAAVAVGAADATDDEGSSTATERRASTRGDLDSLVRMLEGLFVENFTLRGGARWRKPTAAAAAPSVPEQPAATATPEGGALDLSEFVVEEDVASDDDDRNDHKTAASHPGPRDGVDQRDGNSKTSDSAVLQAAGGDGHLMQAPSSSPRSTALEDEVPSATPRTRLLRRFDFSSMSVKE